MMMNSELLHPCICFKNAQHSQVGPRAARKCPDLVQVLTPGVSLYIVEKYFNNNRMQHVNIN